MISSTVSLRICVFSRRVAAAPPKLVECPRRNGRVPRAGGSQRSYSLRCSPLHRWLSERRPSPPLPRAPSTRRRASRGRRTATSMWPCRAALDVQHDSIQPLRIQFQTLGDRVSDRLKFRTARPLSPSARNSQVAGSLVVLMKLAAALAIDLASLLYALVFL